MSNSLIDFLSNIQIAITTSEYSFVYFDQTSGKIEKISSKQENNSAYALLKVKYQTVENLISGKKRLEDYRVAYNSKIKDFEILESEKNINLKNINNSLLKVERTKNNKKTAYDVVIQQDNKQQCWKFIINKNLTFLKNINDTLFFSITKKNDPNILYRTIMFNITDLVDNYISIPYIYDSEKNLTNTSIFTNKVLDTYAHEVIDD